MLSKTDPPLHVAHEIPSHWHILQSLGHRFIIWVGRNLENIHSPSSNALCLS